MAEADRPDPALVRPIVWIARSKRDLSAMPREVKVSFGLRRYELQQRKTPLDMKPLPQFGSGVYELRESYERNAYRLMYVVNLTRALHVLHVFVKKSKSGIDLPKPDAELIAIRLRRAHELDREG
jgi:phage-related protein